MSKAAVFRFGVPLVDPERGHPSKGVSFHRWLPAGETDALVLLEQGGARLTVWFRSNEVVSQDAMDQEGLLEAQSVQGELTLPVSDSEAEMLGRALDVEPAVYGVAERVIRFVDPPLERLIDVLRVNFGQYWLRSWRPWDPQRQSLGGRCFAIRLRCSVEGGEPVPVVPDLPDSAGTQHSSAFGHDEYIGREDWEALMRLCTATEGPSIAVRTIASAHELLDRREFRHALIEAVTGTELAIKQLILARCERRRALVDATKQAMGARLIAQMVMVSAHLPGLSTRALEAAVKGVELRHALVHHAKGEDREFAIATTSLLEFARAILGASKIRFPGRELMKERQTDWENPSSIRFVNTRLGMANPADVGAVYLLDPEAKD